MPLLTPQILDTFPFSHYTDNTTIQRGFQYYRAGKVGVIGVDESGAVCEVNGNSGEYEVEISLTTNNRLRFSCTCPQAEIRQVCKHMVASAMAVSAYLKQNQEKDWQQKLQKSLDTPVRRSGSNVQRYIGLFLLRESPYYSNGENTILSPAILKAQTWGPLEDYLAHGGDPAQAGELLEHERGWWSHVIENEHQVNPAGCLNLPPEGIAFLNFIIQTNRYYGLFSNFVPYLPMLSRINAPVYWVGRKNTRSKLILASEPVEMRALMARDEGNLVLQAGFELDEKPIHSSKKDTIRIISENPVWVMMEPYLVQVANPQSVPVLESLPIIIPEEDEETFRQRYFQVLANRIPVESDLVHWKTVQVDPVPRLYLHDDEHIIRADLKFGYGDAEFNAEVKPPYTSVMDTPGSWSMTRVLRQPEREAYFFGLLAEPEYRLKRSGHELPYHVFELRARAHPYDFLTRSVPQLVQAGFEIFGRDELKVGRINYSTPSLRVNLKSGIDWFDLEAVVQYGDQQVSLKDVRKSMRRGERYIKLADGSIGQIPEEWLEKYRYLWELAEETDTGYRISDLQLSLTDELLTDCGLEEIPADLTARRERLRSFDRITPQPLPAGFTGELRPYQKHGFDWLHFLREYKFGGILADDMGLGKTIQVLTFLQSMKEMGIAKKATLLVVPKSLLTNWQREAARFTPDLKFLEYLGTARQKDTALFNEYDVILTTYGTMLRDVGLLREYTFHYVILDESQAIKNAVSQSAKAARLLKTDHRLTMTGTPVENSTFELWSQFAFTNPGLLGGMEYFKKEFAAPIEGAHDEEAAATLKKLVYPFILRRTKEQVAPELPPRTERVLYTDMEPAQRKLYTQTREQYRAELMGLIEQDGMADSRMKILEGLLRLRQIAIHPGLVEPKYSAPAPKFDLLLETLETLREEGHKALIFSQFVQTLALLRAQMDHERMSYVYLDGQTRNRQDVVDRFQNDPAVSFFLISLKAGGVGLNLTAADYVIHLDPWWNPAVEMQASDRAHRIGQDKPVFVYKLITRDSVEEKILQLQEQKKQLVENLITTETSFFKSLTRDDVKVLFS